MIIILAIIVAAAIVYGAYHVTAVKADIAAVEADVAKIKAAGASVAAKV